jgi:autophagy-related protein 9
MPPSRGPHRSRERLLHDPSSFEAGFGDEGERYNDIHFRVLYKYHQKLGWHNLLISSICKVLTSLFTVVFTMFIISCVAWDRITSHSVMYFGDALYDTCMPTSWWTRSMYTVFILFWLSHLGETISRLSQINEMDETFNKKLSSLGRDVKWISWTKVTSTYGDNDEALKKYSNIDDYIIGKIMRYDNYLIAMLNLNVFGFDTSWFSFTRFVELSIYYSFRIAFFSLENGLPRDFLHGMNHSVYSRRLRVAFIIMGIFHLVIVAFASVAALVFFTYKNIGMYHKDPTRIGAYQFTPLAKWKLRDFNELPHLFFERLEVAHAEVSDYLNDFGDERFNSIHKLGEFVFASIFTVLMFLSFIHPTMMMKEGWSVFFTMGISGAAFMWCQGVSRDSKVRPDPEERFNELVSVLHYTPMSWDTLSTRAKYAEIRSLFKLRLVVFLQEFISLLSSPFLFIFWLPKRADNIVIFLRDHSEYVAGRGVLCRFALFDEVNHPGSTTSLASHTSELTEQSDLDVTRSMTLKWNQSRLQFNRHFTPPVPSTLRTTEATCDSDSDSDSDCSNVTAKIIF